MEDVLYKLIATIEEVAPHVWAIAVRQSYVEGIISGLSALMVAVISYLSARMVLWAWKTGNENDAKGKRDENGLVVPAFFLGMIISVVTFAAVMMLAADSLRHLFSPEFAAIEILLKTAGVK